MGLLRQLVGREPRIRRRQPARAELGERLPAQRAGRRVVGGLARAGTRRAVGRAVEIDEPRVDLTQRRVIDAQALRNARPVVVQEHVRAARERVHDLARLGSLEIERETFLALHRLEPGDAVLHLAEGLSAERLDLDDARAELGQQRRRERRRHPGGELEHEQICERTPRRSGRGGVHGARRRSRRPRGRLRAGRARRGAPRPGRRRRETHERAELAQAPELRIDALAHVAVVDQLRVIHRLERRPEALDRDVGIRVEDAHPLRVGLLAHAREHQCAQRAHVLRIAQRRREAEARVLPDRVEPEVADEGPELRRRELRELEPDAVPCARIRVGQIRNVGDAQHHRVAGQPVHEVVDARAPAPDSSRPGARGPCARDRAAPRGSRASASCEALQPATGTAA